MRSATTQPVQVRELEDVELRADVTPSSWNEEDQTCEVVWTAGADVLRYDYESGIRYWERLDFAAGAIDLSRLQSGRAPVLDSHSDWSSRDVVGVVLAGSVSIDPVSRLGRCRVRFTRAADAAPVVQRVREGVLSSFSFGYKRHRIEQTAELREGSPVWIVRRWEPFEVSPVPIPADPGAGVRGEQTRSAPKTRCEIIRRSSETMPEPIQPNQTNPDDKARQEAELEAARKQAAEKAQRDERDRASAIRALARRHKIEEARADKLVADGLTLDAARAAILDDVAARDEKAQTNGSHRADVGEADSEKFARELEQGFELRSGRKVEKPGDAARAFAGMRSLRIAQTFLERQGVNVRQLSDVELAKRAFHSSSDFPQALANVQGKTLRQAYEEAPQTFDPFVRRVSVNDFKPVSRVSMSGMPALLKVPEGAQIEDGSITDSAQGYRLFKYGRAIQTTWESLINDDLDAISRQFALAGNSAASLESDLVYLVITGNQVMDEDGVAMIHSSHNNTSTGVLSVASLATARAKIRKQTGPNGRQLNLEARLVLVGPDLEIEASKFLSDISPEQAANTNPLRGKLQGVIAEARLPGTKFWLAATPNQIDTIELATLSGAESVMVDSWVDERTKGMATSFLVARAAAAIDFRWICESTGA